MENKLKYTNQKNRTIVYYPVVEDPYKKDNDGCLNGCCLSGCLTMVGLAGLVMYGVYEFLF